MPEETFRRARFLGAILAGGKSRRMGSDKALVSLEGKPFVRWVYEAVEAATDEVVVVGRSGTFEGIPAIPDLPVPHQGALAGLVAGLEHAGSGHVLLLGVDQPFVRIETLRAITAMAVGLPVVPVDQGVPQVTCAVYPASLTTEARRELEAEGSIRTLLARIPHETVAPATWRGWGEDGRSWFSIDTPELLEIATTRFVPGA